MENSRRTALYIVLNTFFICIVAYFIEYKFYYAKVISIFGTTIICKVVGIIAIFVALRLLGSKWRSIGFVAKAKKIIQGIVAPVIILGVCAVIAFILLKLLVESQGGTLQIEYRIMHSTLDKNGELSSSYISFAIALFSAAISAFMVETLLRGLILQTANKHLRFYASNTIVVVLTIIWHSVIYVFNFTMGTMTTTNFIRSLICSVVIYACAAIRRSLYTRAYGTIWGCIVDFFITMMVINNLPLTINLPYNFVVTNPLAYLVSFMSSKLNNTYATIAFMGMVSVLSMIVMVIFCRILKKRARKKFLKKISENNT